MIGGTRVTRRQSLCLFLASGGLTGRAAAAAIDDGTAFSDGAEGMAGWKGLFCRLVDRRLDVPDDARRRYVALLDRSLQDSSTSVTTAQSFVVVDRCAEVQAAMLIVSTPAGGWYWLGATAVSTGKVGTFEHFVSPLGVFAHSLDNPDFRSEGTLNKNHIRGYGSRGRRIFDFGWQEAQRGWGSGGTSKMRLQMHATDPSVLEQRLGGVESEGCIRIPATLNVFLDMHGVLDADYEAAIADGDKLWVMNPRRRPMPWPGRYMVIVDSETLERPPWSPAPQSALPKATRNSSSLAS